MKEKTETLILYDRYGRGYKVKPGCVVRAKEKDKDGLFGIHRKEKKSD